MRNSKQLENYKQLVLSEIVRFLREHLLAESHSGFIQYITVFVTRFKIWRRRLFRSNHKPLFHAVISYDTLHNETYHTSWSIFILSKGYIMKVTEDSDEWYLLDFGSLRSMGWLLQKTYVFSIFFPFVKIIFTEKKYQIQNKRPAHNCQYGSPNNLTSELPSHN